MLLLSSQENYFNQFLEENLSTLYNFWQLCLDLFHLLTQSFFWLLTAQPTPCILGVISSISFSFIFCNFVFFSGMFLILSHLGPWPNKGVLLTVRLWPGEFGRPDSTYSFLYLHIGTWPGHGAPAGRADLEWQCNSSGLRHRPSPF